MKLLRSNEAVGKAQVGDIPWHQEVRCEYGVFTPAKLWFAIEINREFPQFFTVQEALEIKTSKKGVKELLSMVTDIYGGHTAGRLIDKLIELSKISFTRTGASIGMDDLHVLNGISAEARQQAYEEYIHDRDHEKFSARLQEIISEAKTPILSRGELPIVDLVASGSRGNYTQLSQMVVSKGAIVNASGQLEKYPVFHSFYEGINTYEMFSVTKASRPSVAQSKTQIGESGYLTARLVKACRDLVITEEDCGTTNGIFMPVKAAQYRFDTRGKLITGTRSDLHLDSRVQVRSPVTCESKRGCCAKCYGYTLDFNIPAKVGYPIGVASGQALGEPTTQMMLRTFHTSSVGSLETVEFKAPFDGTLSITEAGKFKIFKIDDGLQLSIFPINNSSISGSYANDGDNVEAGKVICSYKRFQLGIGAEVESISSAFEMQQPKAKAVVAGKDGNILYEPMETGVLVRIQDNHGKTIEGHMVSQETEFLFASGAFVHAGEKLTTGFYDFKELVKTVDLDIFYQLFIDSLYNIYVKNGAPVNIRDIETILAGMTFFRKAKENKNGLTIGDIVIKSDERLEGVDADTLVFGISKAIQSRVNFVDAASAGWVKKALSRSLVQEVEMGGKSAASRLAAGGLIDAGSAINGKYLE